VLGCDSPLRPGHVNNAGSKVNFPYELKLEPINRALVKFPAGKNFTTEAVLGLLRTIPVGTKLFNVVVRPQPGAAFEKIGEFNLASQCSYSMFADLRLTFQHRRIEDDLALRPEWNQLVKDWCDEMR